MITRRNALIGAVAAAVTGPALAGPAFTWTTVTWQGREYMQGHYGRHWAACRVEDFPAQREGMEQMLRNIECPLNI